MTLRDTHELRLDRWPRLSTFPTTNAVIAGAIALDFLTFLAWFILTITFLLRAADAPTALMACKAAGDAIPNGWFLFLAGLHGIATTHFGVKRKTDFRNGGTTPPDVPPTP
jgi:hypothetical protein